MPNSAYVIRSYRIKHVYTHTHTTYTGIKVKLGIPAGGRVGSAVKSTASSWRGPGVQFPACPLLLTTI